jgi:transposase-like protein
MPTALPTNTKLRSSKYLNNLIEQDHRGVKQRIAVMLGFKEFRNRRSRSPASSYCSAFGRDSSDRDV